MVKLHIKKGDESQFLFETTVEISIDDLLKPVTSMFNGRLKVQRICLEIGELADHGITLPPNMQGLNDEQISELKLVDEWAEKCEPSGGHVFKQDDIGRRNGRAPNDKMSELLKKTVAEAKDMISKKQVTANVCMTLNKVTEALDILRGAVMIVYPMGLPPHDPIHLELRNEEDLAGTQAAQEVIPEELASLWFSGKEMVRGKKLMDFIGRNEKTKIVCKLQKRGQGAPGREPVVSEDDQKSMMAYYYKKQEEFKKLEQASEDAYLDSNWADNQSLKNQLQGLSSIDFRPGKPM